MKRGIDALVALNSCVWPYVFAAYAILTKDYYRVFVYVGAGAIFGGIVFWVLGSLLAALAYRFPDRPFVRKFLEAAPPARKFMGAGAILIALGVACLIGESFRYMPSNERL